MTQSCLRERRGRFSKINEGHVCIRKERKRKTEKKVVGCD